MAVKLTIKPPRDADPRVVEFDESSVSIGRSSRCDIRLPFRVVSGHHLTIARADDAGYQIRDEASTNGTLIDGEPMAHSRDYPLRSGTRLDIVDLSIHIDLVPTLGAGVPLEKTGTIVRQMLGEALLEHAGSDEDVESAHFSVHGGPDDGARRIVPDDLESGRIADEPGAELSVAGLPVVLEIFRQGDGFGIRPADPSPPEQVTVAGVPLAGDRPLSSGDEIVAGAVRLRFTDPLEGFLQELDGIVPAGAGGEVVDGAESATADGDDALVADGPAPGEDAEDTGLPAGATTHPTGATQAAGSSMPSVEEHTSENPDSTGPGWGLVEVGVVIFSLALLLGVVYLLLTIFGVL